MKTRTRKLPVLLLAGVMCLICAGAEAAGPFGGRRPRGGGSGGDDNTPGKPLISTHAKGSGDIRRYGAVEPTAGEDSMQVLTLGGEELALSCGGQGFTASVEEDELTLRTEDGEEWSLGMDVLKTLNLSGIRRLRLISPAGETALDTDLELTGAVYGRERAQGFVSADFRIVYRQGEWTVRVDDREYRLSGNELA